MKSVFVEHYGGPEVLVVKEVPKPQPAANEVRIKVRAAGLNYADVMQREGLYPGGPKPPFGAGFEVAGTVDALGSGVAQWTVGDRVMGFCSAGYSEFVVAPADRLLPIPDSLGFDKAAAIPCQYLTAYHALLTLSSLNSGQTVLIQAAAGGLGSMLVQIARNVGATVFGTCSSPEKAKVIEELGCHFPIIYTSADFETVINEQTKGKKCDLVVESVGGDVFEKSLRCVKPRGRLITLGVASKQPSMIPATYLLANNITVSGFHLMAYAGDLPAMMNAMRDLLEWLEAGSLKILVNHHFTIEQAADAQRLLESRKSTGKIVIEF
ncbi:MAG: NADPH:quinone oxidoreductase [Candidatus Hydrogenedentota bacterium]